MVLLEENQKEAVENLRNGSLLWADVGTGKSITSIAYYYTKVCNGVIRDNGSLGGMMSPRDLFIITKAKKRDSKDWEQELLRFELSDDICKESYGTSIVVDSWNNIEKYKDVTNAFFIFDEHGATGKGKWSKLFVRISKQNEWILLSATPGDKWIDYVPFFIANGYFRTRSEFERKHVLLDRFVKYKKIVGYYDEARLYELKAKSLVRMRNTKTAIHKNMDIMCCYSHDLYSKVVRQRWDPYDDKPIDETGKLLYLMRRTANDDISRTANVKRLYMKHRRVIVFYNYSYELESLRELCEIDDIPYAEWNGQKHQEIPSTDSWIYLTQFAAGAEGWNCIQTNAMIFYSQTYSYKQLVQAKGRIDRLNTPYDCLYYYHLKSLAPIDKAISEKLKNKEEFNENDYLKKIKVGL